MKRILVPRIEWKAEAPLSLLLSLQDTTTHSLQEQFHVGTS